MIICIFSVGFVLFTTLAIATSPDDSVSAKGMQASVIGLVVLILVFGTNIVDPHLAQHHVRRASTELQRIPKSNVVLVGHHEHIRYRTLAHQPKGFIVDRRIQHSWSRNMVTDIFNITPDRSARATDTYYVPKGVKVIGRLDR